MRSFPVLLTAILVAASTVAATMTPTGAAAQNRSRLVIGMQLAIKPGDEVITGYRDHGHMLACGMDPKGVMAS